MNLKNILFYKGIKHKELTNVLKMDKQLVSKIVNYQVLPVPLDAKKICEFLKCDILDIYDEKEINIKNCVRSEKNNSDKGKYYRLSVRLKLGSCNLLRQTKKLKDLGYKSIADWVRKKIAETELEYKTFKKQKRLSAKSTNTTDSPANKKV